jgi:class 3 adenylate cyclase/CheY-like chemotaxis protein
MSDQQTNDQQTSDQQPVEHRGNILIVDDTPENLQLLSRMLTLKGYEVRGVTSGQMALTAVRVAPPELILLDIRMPHMNGYEVCRQLKADPQTCEIPVIFISALAEIADKTHAFEAGGVDYITKPFWFAEVLARIETHLTIRRLQQQLKLQNEELRRRQDEADRLLLSIMPQSIAERLKRSPQIIADSFDDVTVLFADIVNFTALTAHLSANELVSLLNKIFSGFDQLVAHYNLEKIKTIGDEYMVAGGLPDAKPDHVEAVAEMAIAMQQQIAQFHTYSGEPFQLRIGINTGSVVAGVIGFQKFAYDLWSNTVNIASRMQSQGLAGSIQVTETTYQRLRNKYEFEERGEIEIKGIGELKTYWLKGKRDKTLVIRQVISDG